jgi:hypothetical protein
MAPNQLRHDTLHHDTRAPLLAHCLQIGNDNFCEVLAQLRGPEAVAEWKQLQVDMRPLAQASALMPPAAFRADVGVLLTALARYFPSLLQSGGNALKLTGPFSNVGG